jgi:mannose-6-phosphate isomerase-like protein (cupin superfamily)
MTTDPTNDAAPLAERYWFLTGNEARAIDVPVPEFWEQLISGSQTTAAVRDVATLDGWLVSAYEMSHDMTSAEMHPDGDEFHFLVSGRLDLVLEEDPGNRVVELTAGSSTAVARGVWHRFVVREPSVGLAVTFGRGTQHRPARF